MPSAVALVAIDDYVGIVGKPELVVYTAIFVVLGAVIGSVTFSGSLIASGKLQGIVPGQPIIFPGARLLTALTAVIAAGGLVALVLDAMGTLALTPETQLIVLGLI